MYKVTEINDFIDNTSQSLKGRVDLEDGDITVIIDSNEFCPTIANLKQLIKFLNRVIKEAS